MSERADGIILHKLYVRLLEVAPDYANANTRDAIRAVAHAIENVMRDNDTTLREISAQRRRTAAFHRRMP